MRVYFPQEVLLKSHCFWLPSVTLHVSGAIFELAQTFPSSPFDDLHCLLTLNINHA
jgi:hypothetical protein